MTTNVTNNTENTGKVSFINRFLNWIERTGNKLPDPLTLFVFLTLGLLVFSAIASSFGLMAIHPADQKEIVAQNLLSTDNLRRIFTEMVKNFASFPPLGMVIVTMIGIGVAERTGLITVALKKVVTAVPSVLLPAALVFAGVMSSMVADAGYVVLTPLGAVLFAAFGRHPLAGLAAAFAGVSGGFSANLFITSLDPLLSGISTKAAQIVDPAIEVSASANYYFMVVSTLLLTVVGSFVVTHFVEPRLGKWSGANATNKEDSNLGHVSDSEKKGLWAALGMGLLFVLFTMWLVLPEGAALREPETGGLKPFYDSLVTLIMLLFLLCGLVYGWVTRQIKSDKDVVQLTADSIATLGGYIVLAFVAAQFIAYFNWSNLGLIIAINGAEFLKSLGLTGIPLILMFVLVTASVNLFIGSASAKWAIMAPVFIPMLMLVGYSPDVVQAAYRVGDSVTNIISPLLPYFPIILAFAKKYEPKLGLGTLISLMIPFSIAFLIMWSLLLTVWMLVGLPFGPG